MRTVCVWGCALQLSHHCIHRMLYTSTQPEQCLYNFATGNWLQANTYPFISITMPAIESTSHLHMHYIAKGNCLQANTYPFISITMPATSHLYMHYIAKGNCLQAIHFPLLVPCFRINIPSHHFLGIFSKREYACGSINTLQYCTCYICCCTIELYKL